MVLVAENDNDKTEITMKFDAINENDLKLCWDETEILLEVLNRM